MAAVAALLTLEPPAVDEAMLMAIPTGAAESIRPASPFPGSRCYAEAQGLHVACQCRRATGTSAGSGLAGNGCCCAAQSDQCRSIGLVDRFAVRGAAWGIKSSLGLGCNPLIPDRKRR